MIRSARRQALAMIGLMFAFSAVCATAAPVLQEKISPVSDYMYKKDYAQVEAISKETDPQKRANLLMAYVKERPISRMLDYVTKSYLECAGPYLKSKDWNKALAMVEAFSALMPTEASVKAEAVPEPGAGEFIKTQLIPAQRNIQSTLLAIYFQSNNLPKAAEIAEKLYADTSDKNMAATLADIYWRMKNYDKYLVYGEKILAAYPIDQAYVTALQMAQVYAQKQDMAKTKALYDTLLAAFGDKVPPGMKEADWNSVRVVAHSLNAAEAYAQKDYPKAIQLYELVAKFDPKRDDAYYYIGMSKWNSKDPEGAIEAFAKTVVLGKTNAQKAQQYMEELYKARHNNTLDGLDAVLAKAKADLGIS